MSALPYHNAASAPHGRRRLAANSPSFPKVVAVSKTFPINLLCGLLLLICVYAAPARADLSATVSSEQSSYVRGRTNTFVFQIGLISQNFEGADNIHFGFPDGVTVSAVRYLDGFHTCPDALLLALGMGAQDGGFFNPGHPSGCGYFASATTGEPHRFAVDAEIPAGYGGDLPILVSIDGDGCCDPPPHDDSVTLNFADNGSPARWSFDDVAAPALPAGWSAAVVAAGELWLSESDTSDTAPNALHAGNADSSGEAVLTSAGVAVDAAGGELRFRQRYATDSGRDGGVLDIAIDEGAFQDIVAAGGQFSSGGYSGTLEANADCAGADANPLLGRAAWTGAQDTYSTVAVTLPAAAAGHKVRFRWRLGTDCTGAAPAPNGWWIDSVELTPPSPHAVIGPAKLAVSTASGAQRSETIGIANAGGGALSYALAIGSDDCAGAGSAPWLHLANSSGTLAGGASADVAVQIDASGLADGDYSAQLCVTTNDAAAASMQIPVRLNVASGTCAVFDRVFANGFDDADNGECGTALRSFTDRDAFLRSVADGYAEDAFTGLRTGYINGPIDFGNDAYTYSVFTQDGALGGLYLFAGAGVLSTSAADDHVVITFTGAPVNALGGNFWGRLFFSNVDVHLNVDAPTTIVLTLDNGSSETFTANGPDDFRGFIAASRISSLTVSALDPTADGERYWGVVDGLIVGRAR